jgi:hypothetical protein
MMHLSERQRSIILFTTPFCAVALLAFYVLQTAGGETSRPAGGGALAHARSRSRLGHARGSDTLAARRATRPSPSADDSTEDFQIISRRNIFRPLIEPKKVKMQRSMQRYMPPANIKPLPPLIPPMPIQRAPQMKTPVPPQPPASPTNGIAVVGTVNVNGVMHGVVEDTIRHETRFIRVGEEAFGFRLKQIDDERAVLERDGKTFTLNLGANKEDQPVRLPVQPQPVNAAKLESLNNALNAELAILGEKVQSQGGTANVQPK